MSSEGDPGMAEAGNLRPCWKTLIEALRHQTVGEEGAAADLHKFVIERTEAS